MDSAINYTIEDGKNLSKTIDEQLTLLQSEGFDVESNTKLKDALTELEQKEKLQIKSVNDTDKKAAVQIKVVKQVISLIKRVRETARGAYEGEPKKLKKYKFDEQVPRGIGALCALCDYLSPIVEEEKEVLLKNGLMQADIDALAAASGKVQIAGSDRKRNIKLQKSATIVRNDSADAAKKIIRKIRKFAKARFAERPEILVLFEPIAKSRGTTQEEESPVVVEEAKK